MTPLFQYELLNQPFGDPALYVRLAGERKALLFDLGNISFVKAGKLCKISDVYVSHTHMDHFIGFDHLIRLNLARDRTIRICGPKGMIQNVKGKLKGYTWDLVDSYPFIVEVVEIHARTLRIVQFFCKDRFKHGDVRTVPYEDALDSYPHYTVKALSLDHKITSIAYSLEERFHININKDRLVKLGLPAGKWLRELKDHIWDGKPDEWPVRISGDTMQGQQTQEITLGRLKKDIVTITRGQKIVYISDCRGINKNFKRVIPFVCGADILFCEAAFLEKDSDKAVARGHLTARQAGFIAREAGVRELQVYHFSPRYEHCPELLYQEAQQEFKGNGHMPGKDIKEQYL